MTLVRKQKEDLIKKYKDLLQGAEYFFIVRNMGVSVPDETNKRKKMAIEGLKVKTIRKRLFLKVLDDMGIRGDFDIPKITGVLQVFVADSEENSIKGLKVFYDMLVEFKKNKEKKEIEFLGGYMGGKRYEGEYVSQLASIPGKDVLISKLLYLFKYPLQGFAMVLNEIGKKGGDDVLVKDLVSKVAKEEVKEDKEKVEENK